MAGVELVQHVISHSCGDDEAFSLEDKTILECKFIIIIIIITLFQEGDIYITIVNHDGPQNNRNNITIKISLV